MERYELSAMAPLSPPAGGTEMVQRWAVDVVSVGPTGSAALAPSPDPLPSPDDPSPPPSSPTANAFLPLPPPSPPSFRRYYTRT